MAEILNNYKVTAEILTPVHIGNGITLTKDCDFVEFDNSNVISVINENKVYDILGDERMNDWVRVIENKYGLKELLQLSKQNLLPKDIDSRSIECDTTPVGNFILEQIRTANGNYLLPGSSLKGAIRTAILTKMIHRDNEDDSWLQNNRNLVDKKGRFSGNSLIKHFFGENPNYDFLRLLRISDLEYLNCSIFKCNTINLRSKDWVFKNDVTQWIESIKPNQEAEFRISIFNNEFLERYKHLIPKEKSKQLEINNLFEIINWHTERMLYNEIAFWEDENASIAEEYISELDNSYNRVSSLKPNECIIRVGFGGGWDFMTGAWQEQHLTKDQFENLIKSLRKPFYFDEYGTIFPKTRKFTSNGIPLGFLKLTY